MISVRTLPWLAWLGWLPLAGCSPSSLPAPPPPAATVTPTDLRAELDAVLDYTMQQRRLNAVDHGAWQILHGVLAFQQPFPVQVGPESPPQSALEYVLDGGRIDGWTFEPGDVLDASSGRRGLRAVVEAGTKRGQGHADQWLAILAQCELTLDQTIRVDGQEYTMGDLVRQVQWDLPRNVEQEFSWTLIGLTSYLPTTARWTARDGQTWSIERLVQTELDQDLRHSACGGTHRMIGVAMALNRHRASTETLNGVWKEADQRVQQAIQDARQMQNADGSFSSHYFERPGQSPDLALGLSTTGHILEFLALAMPQQQLADPWVARATGYLCQLFRQTQDVALECGALYHAAHGLVLYRDRIFGARTYAP